MEIQGFFFNLKSSKMFSSFFPFHLNTYAILWIYDHLVIINMFSLAYHCLQCGERQILTFSYSDIYNTSNYSAPKLTVGHARRNSCLHSRQNPKGYIPPMLSGTLTTFSAILTSFWYIHIRPLMNLSGTYRLTTAIIA